MSHTRVAVVQIDFHPAALVDRHSPLEDPLFQLNTASSWLPASGVIPAELIEPFEQLRARVRREHNRCLMLKLRAVLERCRAWGVKLVVLPEYSVGAELLPELAAIAPELVLVAGTHAVERALQREGIYAQLGWPEAPRSGMAVAPVLHRGRLLALQSKLSATKPERGNLILGDRWDPIKFDLGGGPAIPGPLGVMICLDFLFRERPEHREQVGPGLDRVRFLAVPSYTPWHSAGEFAAEAWQEARRYGRPVLWANVASQGGSSIFVDEGQVGELQNYPRRVGLLERGDEGVIVADVDLGYQRAGDSTRYGGDSIVKPVAVASLLYRHHPISDRYATWVEEFELRLDTISEDAAADLVEGARTLLLEAASLSAGQARTRRLRRLLAEVKRINIREEFRQFTREVVLPGAALPLDVLRQVWARECADIVFEWMRAHRGAGLEEVELRLRAGGKLEVEAALWTEAGREALRETSEAIRGNVSVDVPQLPVLVRERVPSSVPLHQLELEGEGLRLVFRATPGDLPPRHLLVEAKGRPDGHDRRRSPDFVQGVLVGLAGDREVRTREGPDFIFMSSRQPESARRAWLLQRAHGRLDATVLGVDGLGGSAVLVCVREDNRRILLAPADTEDAEWLRIHTAAILRVAASCCDELRWLDANAYAAAIDKLLERFAGAQPVIDAAVEFQLRALNQASAEVLVRVDDHEQTQVGLEALDAWLQAHEQAALVVGAFGTGKSTLLAQWCQRRWQQPGARPILANLATGGHSEPIAALLVAAGCDPESEPDRAALSLLLLERKVIACFDGFDEMATRLVFADVPQRLATLLEVAGTRGKVLLGSRDHYFSSKDVAEHDMMQALALANMHGLTRVRLQPFGTVQVTEVVEQFITEPEHRQRVLEKIRSTYDLEDLVQTPMLLSMVLQTIDELAPGARVGSASIYERYLERFLDHAEVGAQELFSRANKRAFAEDLAAELWRSGEPSLAYERLHASVRAGLSEQLPTDVPTEAAFLEIQGGSFLVRDGDDRFRFAHKSFLEFFMAKGLLAALERSPEQVLDTARLTPEVAAFVAELLRVRGNGVEDPAITALQRWLVTGREPRLEGSARAAANALRLLRDVAREFGQRGGWVPERADLRRLEFDGEELVGLRLYGARLGRARMIGVEFGDADLRGASIQDADLRDARFRGARLDEVVFERTDLSGVEGHDCSLRGASFRKVEMRLATWTGCQWGDVAIEDVVVGPTIVAGMDPSTGGLQPPFRGSRLVVGTEDFHGANSVAWSPDGRYIASASYDTTVCIWHSDDGRLLSTLQGHSSRVNSVAWSRDGVRIASASDDHTICIWHANTGCLLSTLQGADAVSSVDWAPDGIHLVSASGDYAIRIWHVNEQRVLATLQGHSAWVASVAWAPDGIRIASASDDHTVRIWHADGGYLLSTLQGHSHYVNSVAWAPDGIRIATASSDRTIRIWHAADGRLLSTIQGHSESVSSVDWAPDGIRIATASSDNTIRIWHADGGDLLCTLHARSSWNSSVAWAPDGIRIASTSASSIDTIHIWHAADGSLIATIQAHYNAVNSVAWAPDGTRIAFASIDHIIRIWHANDGHLSSPLQGYSVAWAPDGVRIASASSDHAIRIWHADDGRVLSTLHGHSQGIRSFAWAREGDRIASASHDYTACIWDANDGRLLSILHGHFKSVNSVAWAPDGSRIATASSDRTIRIWHADDGRLLSTLEGHSSGVNAVVWAPDGLRIASASDDRTVCIWHADDGHLLTTLEGHSSGVNSVAWSLDGFRIASASGDSTIRIWHADDGHLLSILEGHSSVVRSIAWAPDGSRIASASDDSTIRIWHADPTRLPLARTASASCVSYAPDGTSFVSGSDDETLRLWQPQSRTEPAIAVIHKGKPLAVTHSPSGEHLASASSDCRVRIWDANTLVHLRTLAGHTRDVKGVAYSPDGKLLASGSADRTIRLWNPATGDYLATASHDHWVNCVAFSPDGSKLASGSSNRDICVWSIPTLDKLLEIPAHSDYVNGIVWHPDGKRFVSSSWDHKLRVWDAGDGHMIHELLGHSAPIRGVAFAPDGTRFASVADDKTLQIWDAETYERLEQFHSDARLMRVAWSPDSAQVIAGSRDGVQIWRVEPCLAILQAHGQTSLVRTPSGQFYLQPESATAYLEVPRQDRAAVFYLPLAGIRDHQSRDAVARSLAGLPTRSLAQTLGWAPLGWDGEVRSITVARSRGSRVPLALVPAPPLEIITNPFSPNTALRNASSLPGRRAEIDRVVQVLRRRGVAWLRGPRRAGKTSFLDYVAHHSRDHQVFSRSLQAGSVQTPDDIARLLADDLRDVVKPADELVARLAKLDAPVIMLDEIAVLAEAQAGTLRWLRALGQERASLIYSGSHHDWVLVKQRMREVPGSSFGNDVDFIDFGPIPEPDALQFLVTTAPQQAPISSTLASWVVQECGTWPYYLQVLGYALVAEQTVFQRTPAAMSRGDFQEFYRRVLLHDNEHYFELRWQEFTVHARAILRAALGTGRDPRTLTSPAGLSDAEKRVLRDEGAMQRGNWVIDKPFLDWMLENIDMLGEVES